MGIRLSAFAIDVQTLDRILDRPLWQIFGDLRSRPSPDDILFNAYDESTETRYVVRGERVFRTSYARLAEPEAVDSDTLVSVDFLRQPLRQYLQRASPYDLLFFLLARPFQDEHRYCELVTRGHKTWWTDSVLAATEALFPPPLHNELARFFARIERSYAPDRAYASDPALRHDSFRPVPYTFPVPFLDDPDIQMAVLEPPDVSRFVDCLHQLMQLRPEFHPLPEGNQPEADAEWDGYVHERVREFLHIRDLSLPNMHLVTFIS